MLSALYNEKRCEYFSDTFFHTIPKLYIVYTVVLQVWEYYWSLMELHIVQGRREAVPLDSMNYIYS